jgi:hypothetical protein
MYCSDCSSSMSLIYKLFDESIEHVRMVVDKLPMLRCDRCSREYFPERSRKLLISLFKRATDANRVEIYVKRKKPREDFGYTKIPFIYDVDDYHYIPGLQRPHSEGYLTPVYFKKSVLIKYDNTQGYQISLGSRTYGTITKGFDWSIDFGINRRGKVIMLLGDIGMLPKNEQHYLRSENVRSDHSIGSEFYEGQIEARFTDPSPEDNLIRTRSEFHKAAAKRFGKQLTKLDQEVLDLIQELTPPLAHSRREQKHIVDVLNKINVESLDSGTIGSLIKQRGASIENPGSLKRLQQLYELEFSDYLVGETLSPFFVLYDLRVKHAHLTSSESYQDEMRSAAERLRLEGQNPSFEAIYGKLLETMIAAYDRLTELSYSETPQT